MFELGEGILFKKFKILGKRVQSESEIFGKSRVESDMFET